MTQRLAHTDDFTGSGGELGYAEALEVLDERVGSRAEVELVNARGIRRAWKGVLRRRRSIGLPAARITFPVPVEERWLTIGGRSLPTVIRRQDFVAAERLADALVLRLGQATLIVRDRPTVSG